MVSNGVELETLFWAYLFAAKIWRLIFMYLLFFENFDYRSIIGADDLTLKFEIGIEGIKTEILNN